MWVKMLKETLHIHLYRSPNVLLNNSIVNTNSASQSVGQHLSSNKKLLRKIYCSTRPYRQTFTCLQTKNSLTHPMNLKGQLFYIRLKCRSNVTQKLRKIMSYNLLQSVKDRPLPRCIQNLASSRAGKKKFSKLRITKHLRNKICSQASSSHTLIRTKDLSHHLDLHPKSELRCKQAMTKIDWQKRQIQVTVCV